VSDDVRVEVGDDHVAIVEFDRPPNNHFDVALIAALADAYEALDDDPECRAIVLCSAGRHFCAGADFAPGGQGTGGASLYAEAVRMFAARTPVVAAVQGAAVGGGLGVAMSADFRVASPETRFVANFAKLGIHHGFGLTVTLPPVVGQQRALEMLYTGARLKGEHAHAIGLADRLATAETLRDEARALAADIAASAPLAVRSIRATHRGDLAEEVRAATEHEEAEQAKLMATSDFREGVASVTERRPGNFTAT
jgi:2-(1,2-epoxy-1,2-dihydrophenyl)acetyl-CoA isomerase